MQAVADLTQLPVELYPSPDATALGAAALGRLAGQPGLALEQAVPDWTPVSRYEPVWTADRAAAFRQRWCALAAATLPAKET
jgi:sugar (pentulose or hexulose) kinase